MASKHVGTTVRSIVAVVLFGFGVVTGSVAFSAAASPTSTSSCATDARAQGTQDTTWAAPPQSETGRPGQPF